MSVEDDRLSFLGLRELGGSDGGEEFPVGSAGVEECSDSVVGEVPEPKRCSFDPFYEIVQAFCGPVGDCPAG